MLALTAVWNQCAILSLLQKQQESIICLCLAQTSSAFVAERQRCSVIVSKARKDVASEARRRLFALWIPLMIGRTGCGGGK